MQRVSLRNMGALVALLASMGCASIATENLRKERGYSEGDIAEVNRYTPEYKRWVSQGTAQSNALNGAPLEAALTRVRNIYCGCIKKLGPARCTKSGQGLAAEDYLIWVKGNAAEMAITTSFVQGNTVDPAECI